MLNSEPITIQEHEREVERTNSLQQRQILDYLVDRIKEKFRQQDYNATAELIHVHNRISSGSVTTYPARATKRK